MHQGAHVPPLRHIIIEGIYFEVLEDLYKLRRETYTLKCLPLTSARVATVCLEFSRVQAVHLEDLRGSRKGSRFWAI